MGSLFRRTPRTAPPSVFLLLQKISLAMKPLANRPGDEGDLLGSMEYVGKTGKWSVEYAGKISLRQ